MNTVLSRIREVLTREEAPLRLYKMDYCYYCRRVEREARKLGVQLNLIDVFADSVGRERLRTKMGRTRVPVLGIMDGKGQEKFLPESDDIIDYLRELAKKKQPKQSA